MPLQSDRPSGPGRYGGVDEPYDLPVDFPPGHPDDGKHFAMDADLTVYWPYVRPCWEESRDA